ncbi:PhzF family phenazine biosynthesis protein [Streptomyces sp. BE303]|uniref:PhzF family phenazine biosynthesis protein n=1 Tax=Streptomyces sp. BE303 TaxID=3002528 RepID=UPI002E789DF1|nr:PhzF family phenazine biosynthesis protein [Streptomyces sp. BE303]MED7952457.1 PhzF family phenazine biosynthesis protein [Streptomyces sp. BE303]
MSTTNATTSSTTNTTTTTTASAPVSAPVSTSAIRIPIFQVDAFTDRLLWGNPAAVCPLDSWLPAPVMQAIALENNLPETAFIVRNGDAYDLRWFTPATEVDLCGHATLGAAHVVLTHLEPDWNEVTFHSASGPLVVARQGDGDRFGLTFPALEFTPVDPPADLLRGLGPVAPTAVYRSMDYIAVYENEAQVRAVVPDPRALSALDLRGVVVTAPGDGADFCSRFFGPKLSIPEDPITGSAHCALVPYWAERLGRTRLHAHQFSPRLGRTRTISLDCELTGDRVGLIGAARPYMTGVIQLSEEDLDQSPDPARRP